MIVSNWRAFGLVLGAGLGLWLMPAAPVRAAKAQPSYFNTVEIRRDNLKPFPKWRGVLARFAEEQAAGENDCASPRFNRCHYETWMAFIDSQRGRPVLAQISAVHAFMNTHRYIVDPINWGVKDYWATPGQFFNREGDCEDYAIAKFLTLRALGVANDAMRIVVLQDLNLRIAHAVLIVENDGRRLVLDNQIKTVVDQAVIRHYRPIYSVNESNWWLHRPVKQN